MEHPRSGLRLRSNAATGQIGRNPLGGSSLGRRLCCSLLTDPCGYARCSRLACVPNPMPRTSSYLWDTTLGRTQPSVDCVRGREVQKKRSARLPLFSRFGCHRAARPQRLEMSASRAAAHRTVSREAPGAAAAGLGLLLASLSRPTGTGRTWLTPPSGSKSAASTPRSSGCREVSLTIAPVLW